jgi:hypothetical protein
MRRLLVIVLVAGLAAPAAAHAAGLRVTNTLVFTRTDGSLVEYPFDVRVWCGRWEPNVPVRTLHVRIGWSRPRSRWSLSEFFDGEPLSMRGSFRARAER